MGGGNDAAGGDSVPQNRVVKTNNKSLAAKWNRTVMRRLEDVLAKDPEANISVSLPSGYQEALHYKKQGVSTCKPFPDRDIRSKLDPTLPATVVSMLSAKLEKLLSPTSCTLSEAIAGLLANGDGLFQAAAVTVFRISREMAVKITTEANAATEHHTLIYLRQHLPSFPAPEPRGVIRSS